MGHWNKERRHKAPQHKDKNRQTNPILLFILAITCKFGRQDTHSTPHPLNLLCSVNGPFCYNRQVNSWCNSVVFLDFINKTSLLMFIFIHFKGTRNEWLVTWFLLSSLTKGARKLMLPMNVSMCSIIDWRRDMCCMCAQRCLN